MQEKIDTNRIIFLGGLQGSKWGGWSIRQQYRVISEKGIGMCVCESHSNTGYKVLICKEK